MKKIFGVLVIVACVGTTQAQQLKIEPPPYKLLRALEIFEKSHIIDALVYEEGLILSSALPVTISLANPTEQLLKDVLKAQPKIKFTLAQKTLTLEPEPPEVAAQRMKQFVSICYIKVYNDSGIPLEGASLKPDSKTNIYTSNAKGYAEVPGSPGDSITITYVYYKSERIPWQPNEKPTIVRLKALDQNLVVASVTGHTTKDPTASISKFKSYDPKPGGIMISIVQNVAGVLGLPSSGLAAVSQKIQFRGPTSIGTLTGTLDRRFNSPLFVVNGIPWAPSQQPLNQLPSIAGNPGAPGISATGFDPFFTINSYDVESVTVLKDAESTAIYGARGANGVIVITTRKAPDQKLFTAISSFGIGRSLKSMQMMNTPEYTAMRRDAFKKDGIIPNAFNAPDLMVWDTTRYTDFNKLLLNGTATYFDQQISYSEATNNWRYLLSGGYHSQTTVLPGDLYAKRWSLLTDISFTSNNRKTKAGFTAINCYTENKWIAENVMYGLLMAPNAPPLTDNHGNLTWGEDGNSFKNPLRFFKETNFMHARNNSFHTWLQHKINRRLRFETAIGYQFIDITEHFRIPISSQSPFTNRTGFFYKAYNRFNTLNIEPELQYNNSLLRKVQYESSLGASFTAQSNKRQIDGYLNYTNDDLLGIADAAPVKESTSSMARYRFISCFGRLKFNYLDKYFLSLTARVDGSSRFGPNNRYAAFAAVGAAWIFWTDTTKKDLPHAAKIRASYGSTGNDQIGDYAYLNTWNTIGQYQGAPAIAPTGLFNPYYKWEVTRKLEAGLELNLFDKRFNLTVTAYRNLSINQLITYILSGQSGFPNVARNFPAIVQNTGIETEADWKKPGRFFTWTGNLTLAIPKNKLVKFDDLENSPYATTLKINEPLNSFIVPHYTGVDEITGKFTADSMNIRAVSYDPAFFGGIRNSFIVKQLELTFYIEFRKQKAANYLTEIYKRFAPGNTNPDFFTNQPVAVKNRWQKAGDQMPLQQVSTLSFGPVANAVKNLISSDARLVNASYARMKSVRVAYNFPPTLINKWHLQGVSVFANAENLFTITSYKGADPETQDPFSLPLLRTYTIGFQLTL